MERPDRLRSGRQLLANQPYDESLEADDIDEEADAYSQRQVLRQGGFRGAALRPGEQSQVRRLACWVCKLMVLIIVHDKSKMFYRAVRKHIANKDSIASYLFFTFYKYGSTW